MLQLIMPAEGPITLGFAEPYQGYLHRGVDIGVAYEYMVASCSGTSVPFTNDGSFGKGVCILSEGWYVLTAHMSRVDVSVGESVRQGQLIGVSGATGRVTGPHVHWQVCKNSQFPLDISQSVDPMAYLGKEDEVTREEYENLLLALASGQEESLDRATRVANAAYRVGQIAAGERPSVLEVAYEVKGRMDAFSQRTAPGLAADQ